MNKELQKAIFLWLADHEEEWQRINSCKKHFRQYIYDAKGAYIIGGEEVHNFIINADALIYKQ